MDLLLNNYGNKSHYVYIKDFDRLVKESCNNIERYV